MAFPLSVLKSKKIKYTIENVEDVEETYTTKNIESDYKRQIDKLMESLSAYVIPDDLQFIKSNRSYFYHNNIAILLLVLLIMRYQNMGEESLQLFFSGDIYAAYFKYISDGKVDGDKLELFKIKLNTQIKAYMDKIKNLSSM